MVRVSPSRPLRLLMDARYTRTDFHDGISRYGASLIEAVARRTDAPGPEGAEHVVLSGPAELVFDGELTA